MSLDASGLIRAALRTNAVFSAACGAAFLAAGHALGPVFGLAPAVLWVFGPAVLAFAAHAARAASRRPVLLAEALYFVIADAAYVAASVVVLLGFPRWMSGAGRLFFAAVADVVAALCVAEYVGYRRLTRAPREAAA
jgi:hypothetical protein